MSLSPFSQQLRGPFGFIVRAGLSPLAACSLNRRLMRTRPHQRSWNIGRDYTPEVESVNGNGIGDYPYLKWLQRGDGGKVG